jgi:hypothetical protein
MLFILIAKIWFNDDIILTIELCNLQTGCTRLADESDKGYELLADSRLSSPGTPASTTTNIGRHDIKYISIFRNNA